ncbi:hypothetical protein BCR42DRAFT_428538 [Absidia repens]|uniref:Uncharacterized protein n=1 Tax=Absidia repens TaxID=90262 RepID=A0A1X2HYL9_9FUNG|nr:hypothetical protein BCR42DRAFT_428538 [Absidia repens]
MGPAPFLQSAMIPLNILVGLIVPLPIFFFDCYNEYILWVVTVAHSQYSLMQFSSSILCRLSLCLRRLLGNPLTMDPVPFLHTAMTPLNVLVGLMAPLPC